MAVVINDSPVSFYWAFGLLESCYFITGFNIERPLRQIIPGIIAKEIVGVQPMNGPIGKIFTLRSYRC